MIYLYFVVFLFLKVYYCVFLELQPRKIIKKLQQLLKKKTPSHITVFDTLKLAIMRYDRYKLHNNREAQSGNA